MKKRHYFSIVLIVIALIFYLIVQGMADYMSETEQKVDRVDTSLNPGVLGE